MKTWTELMDRYRQEMNGGRVDAAGRTLQEALRAAEQTPAPFRESVMVTTRMAMEAHAAIVAGRTGLEGPPGRHSPASASPPSRPSPPVLHLASFGTIRSSGGDESWTSGHIVLRRLEDGSVAVHIANHLGHFAGLPKRLDAQVDAAVVGAFLGRLKTIVERGAASPRTTRMAVVDLDVELEQGPWRERLEESAGKYDMDSILEAIRAFAEQAASRMGG